MTNVGRNISMYRNEASMSGAQLARDVGISKGYLSDLEHGKKQSVGFDIALRIAEALDIDVRQLAVRRTVTGEIDEQSCWYNPITELWRRIEDDAIIA